MKSKLLVTSLAIGVFGSISVAHAQQVYIDNQLSGMTFQSLVTQGATITRINLTSTGQGPVNPTPVDPTPVDPTPVDPTPVDPPIGCGAVPSNVRVVDVGSLATAFNQSIFRPGSPNEIIAFRITVPTGAAVQSDFRTTKLTASTTSKLVSVSSCPGDYTAPVGANLRGCTKFAYESTRIYLTSDQGASPRSWCILSPGQTYYVNAVSRETLDGTTPTCSSSADCGFYAARQPQ